MMEEISLLLGTIHNLSLFMKGQLQIITVFTTIFLI